MTNEFRRIVQVPGGRMALEVVAAVRQEAEAEDGADHGDRDHRRTRRAAVGPVASAAFAAVAVHLLAAEGAELPPLDLLWRAAVRSGQVRRFLQELVEPRDAAVALERVAADVEVRD